MQIHAVGIDLGKTTFHLVALNAAGKVLCGRLHATFREESRNHCSRLALRSRKSAGAINPFVVFSRKNHTSRFAKSRTQFGGTHKDPQEIPVRCTAIAKLPVAGQRFLKFDIFGSFSGIGAQRGWTKGFFTGKPTLKSGTEPYRGT
jgi:hypothetical protein